MSDGVMQRLREETAPQHRATERRPLVRAMLRGELPEVAFQWKLWGYRELHRRAAAGLSVDADALAGMVRVRERHLDADLEVSLGPIPAPLQAWQAASCSPPDSDAALGWLYVLEGSSLGAQVLLARLATHYPPHLLHYYRGHRGETTAHWQAFSEEMSHLVASPARCVEGARRCFDEVMALFDAVERS